MTRMSRDLALFVVMLLLFSNMIFCLELKNKKSISRIRLGVIRVTVDNVLEKIEVNGKSIALKGSLGDWTSTKTLDVELNPGDRVDITGSNLGGEATANNPAAILADITYFDEDGKSQNLYTDDNWACDGKTAKELGENGDRKVIWYKVKGKPIDNINHKAKWIWVNSTAPRASCSVIIPKKTKSSFLVTVDNNLDKITINNKPVAFAGKYKEWTSVKSINAEFGPGDIIEITGTNEGVTNSNNPAGIIGTLNYIDEDGQQRTINTGEDWACAGRAAKLQGENGDKNSIWNKVKRGPLEGINKQAQWIWHPDSPQTTACSIQIPKKTNNYILLTVDNIIEKITVNGKSVSLNGAINDWTALKTVEASFGPGDRVEITGKNIGGVSTDNNPAAILATLSYIDESGKVAMISTGSDWDCNGKAPHLLGENSDTKTPWYRGRRSPIPKIDQNAQWIWSPDKLETVTCGIFIQKKSNSFIHITIDDIIEKITINNNPVQLYGAINDWNSVKTINADFGPGDKIEITGKNAGSKSTKENPAGLLAALTYLDEEGISQTLLTGANWACNGRSPELLGVNGEEDKKLGHVSSLWYKFRNNKSMDKIPSIAEWIWADDKSQTATCSIIIPKKTGSLIQVTVDDILENVTINGKEVPFSGAVNDWSRSKVIHANFGPGDVIAITGKNQGGIPTAQNPAGILATLTYKTKDGKTITLNTDSTWECNGSPPVLQGKNDPQDNSIWVKVKGGPVENIDQNANWIWSESKSERSTCTITVPKPKRKCKPRNPTN